MKFPRLFEYRDWTINQYLKIAQVSWLHVLPSITIFTEVSEKKFSDISAIEISWLHWQIEINFEGYMDLNEL